MDYRKHNQIDPWDDRIYGTGNTMPPKSHHGLIALLLITIIFLSGIISVLSFLNIRLFQELNQQKDTANIPMSFSSLQDTQGSLPEAASQAPAMHREGASVLALKFEAITRFDQEYFHIPAGLYITAVGENSVSDRAGIQPGDILLAIDGTPVTSLDAVEELLSAYTQGQEVTLTLYNDGQEQILTIPLE